MCSKDLTHPLPWNRDKRVGVGIDFGHVKKYPGGYHYGIDMYAPRGEEILAALDGRAISVDEVDDSAYGKNITLDHGDGLFTVYAHMDEIWLLQDEDILVGEVIGICGYTGNTTGGNSPHLHFEVRQGGNDKKFCVDPMLWIKPKPAYYEGAHLRWK